MNSERASPRHEHQTRIKQTVLHVFGFSHSLSVLLQPLIYFPPSISENDETGVMDSLLEALQSGAAFRDRRKRAPRPRGKSHFHKHTE